jgi:ABC-2 type transport system ATP-binding protein
MPVIKIENMSYTIPFGQTILKNINLRLEESRFLGILGQNGTGKTTLLDILMGFRSWDEGKVEVLNENPHHEFRTQKEKIIFLSQEVVIKGNLSIGQFLKFHSAFYKSYSQEDESQLLEVFRLSKDMKIGALSTGQQKKVQIIAGLATQPKIIVIDEITAVLDPETRDIFFRELENTRKKNSSSIILATNIAEDLIGRADEILFIQNFKASLHHPSEIKKLFNIGEAA